MSSNAVYDNVIYDNSLNGNMEVVNKEKIAIVENRTVVSASGKEKSNNENGSDKITKDDISYCDGIERGYSRYSWRMKSSLPP